MSTRISLDRIVALRVPVAWHEAVAVAQQIHLVAQPGAVAGLDNCLLSAEGDVRIVGTSRAPFAADSGLAVLSALLDTRQAPRELLALIDRYQPDAVGVDLTEALKFFARPDGAAAIGELAMRALAAEAEATQLAEFERLRHEAAGTPPANTNKKKSEPSDVSRSRRSTALAAAAVAVVALAGALALSAARLSTLVTAAPVPSRSVNETSDTPVVQASPIQQLAGRLDALVDKGLATLGLAAAEATPAPEPVARPAAPRLAKRAPPVRGDVAAPVTPLFIVMPPTPLDDPEVVPDVSITVYAEPLPGDMVFEAEDDAGVEPPVLRWPQLPTEPSEELKPSASYLELLINEGGTVDKVRLRSERNSYHDRMLVSAAKAWLFHPAQKNGRAVKYLIKVPILKPH